MDSPAKRAPGAKDDLMGPVDIIRKNSEYKDGVIYFDVSAYDLEGYNKFVPYYLYPPDFSWTGTAAELGVATGLAFLFP